MYSLIARRDSRPRSQDRYVVPKPPSPSARPIRYCSCSRVRGLSCRGLRGGRSKGRPQVGHSGNPESFSMHPTHKVWVFIQTFLQSLPPNNDTHCENMGTDYSVPRRPRTVVRASVHSGPRGQSGLSPCFRPVRDFLLRGRILSRPAFLFQNSYSDGRIVIVIGRGALFDALLHHSNPLFSTRRSTIIIFHLRLRHAFPKPVARQQKRVLGLQTVGHCAIRRDNFPARSKAIQQIQTILLKPDLARGNFACIHQSLRHTIVVRLFLD